MKTLVFGLLMTLSFSSFAKITLVENPSIKFTGYKFTNKAPVSGTFKTVEWKIHKNAKDMKELLTKSTLKIDSHSIDAGDPARNVNLNDSLIKNWGGRYIDVKFTDVNLDRRVVKSQMTIGKVKKDLFFEYYDNGKGSYIFTATMDLLQMGFGDAYASLEELCGPLHTGEDEVRKSWPDVDIVVELKIK